MRKIVCDELAALHAVPIESGTGSGIPDVNHALGWIELKQISRWPVHMNATYVRVHHFSLAQRSWAIERNEARPHDCLFLLHVGKTKDWLLMDGTIAAVMIGHRTPVALVANSIKLWQGGLPAGELLAAIRGLHP